MKGRKFEETGGSSRGRCIRNIADIIPDWRDICSTAGISKLWEIPHKVGDKTGWKISGTLNR